MEEVKEASATDKNQILFDGAAGLDIIPHSN
jgi:hypothetical protein